MLAHVGPTKFACDSTTASHDSVGGWRIALGCAWLRPVRPSGARGSPAHRLLRSTEHVPCPRQAGYLPDRYLLQVSSIEVARHTLPLLRSSAHAKWNEATQSLDLAGNSQSHRLPLGQDISRKICVLLPHQVRRPKCAGLPKSPASSLRHKAFQLEAQSHPQPRPRIPFAARQWRRPALPDLRRRQRRLYFAVNAPLARLFRHRYLARFRITYCWAKTKSQGR